MHNLLQTHKSHQDEMRWDRVSCRKPSPEPLLPSALELLITPSLAGSDCVNLEPYTAFSRQVFFPLKINRKQEKLLQQALLGCWGTCASVIFSYARKLFWLMLPTLLQGLHLYWHHQAGITLSTWIFLCQKWTVKWHYCGLGHMVT